MSDPKSAPQLPLLRRVLVGPGRSLEITKAGWWFLGLTLLVGFTAINSGSNLLHLVFGCQLGMIVGSGILSEIVLRDVEVSRSPTSPVFARSPATLQVRLRLSEPRGSWALAVSVEDDDRVQSPATMRPVFCLALLRGVPFVATTTVSMPRRGRHALPPAVLATRFPFGLFVKRRFVKDQGTLIVYPAVHPVLPEAQQDVISGDTERAAHVRSREGEFHGLKEHRGGEELSRVHWRASARLDRLVVSDFESPVGQERWLVLPDPGLGSDLLDSKLEELTSTVVKLLQDGGHSVGLRAPDGRVMFPSSRGAAHERRLLETFALWGLEDVSLEGGPHV